MMVMCGGSHVSWKPKLQTMVALSSVNAEVVVLCTALTKGLWMNLLVRELGYDIN